MSLAAGPHRRYNPLLDEWVLCSPQRLQRPWQGRVEVEDPGVRAHDPGCYLCPGNTRAAGARNPIYTATFAFANDFPALTAPAASGGHLDDGLLTARAAQGVCRVLCYSPRHDVSLARMERAAIRGVVDAWAEESVALGAREAIGHVQVFENRGELMGCSNPHPHGQIWATAALPTMPARELAAQRTYFAAHGSDLLGDYLEQEVRRGDRLVFANEHWVSLVPFWAVWPFETLLLPRRRVADLPALADAERDALADALRRLTARYDNLFRCSFPYSMGWHQRPTDGAEHPWWRLHAAWYPPLLRSASIRKFLVGYELSAEPQRDLTPEDAAQRLREQPERHYLD